MSDQLLEDRADDIHQELVGLRREITIRETELSRVVNEPEWERSLWRLRQRELSLTMELAEICARLEDVA